MPQSSAFFENDSSYHNSSHPIETLFDETQLLGQVRREINVHLLPRRELMALVVLKHTWGAVDLTQSLPPRVEFVQRAREVKWRRKEMLVAVVARRHAAE